MAPSGWTSSPSSSTAAHPASPAASTTPPAPHLRPRGGRFTSWVHPPDQPDPSTMEPRSVSSAWGSARRAGFLSDTAAPRRGPTQACSGQARVRHACVIGWQTHPAARLRGRSPRETAIHPPAVGLAGSHAMTTLADDLVPDELWGLVAPLLPAPPRPPYGARGNGRHAGSGRGRQCRPVAPVALLRTRRRHHLPRRMAGLPGRRRVAAAPRPAWITSTSAVCRR
jgi:hypothetical protein